MAETQPLQRFHISGGSVKFTTSLEHSLATSVYYMAFTQGNEGITPHKHVHNKSS